MQHYNVLLHQLSQQSARSADLELAAVVVQDVGGLQVAVQHPVVVQVLDGVKQLEHQRFCLRTSIEKDMKQQSRCIFCINVSAAVTRMLSPYLKVLLQGATSTVTGLVHACQHVSIGASCNKPHSLHLGHGEGVRHVLHELLQVVFHELHDHEDAVQGLAHHHLRPRW
jgi:hypothetical protein